MDWYSVKFNGLTWFEPVAKDRLLVPPMPLISLKFTANIDPPPEIGKFGFSVLPLGLSPAFGPSIPKPVVVMSIVTMAASAVGMATKPAPMPVAR